VNNYYICTVSQGVTSQSTRDFCLYFRGATALTGPGPPHYQGFSITLSHTTQSVGLLCTNDQPDAETSIGSTQNSQETDIQTDGGIRTRNNSKTAAGDPRLKQRGNWIQQTSPMGTSFGFIFNTSCSNEQMISEWLLWCASCAAVRCSYLQDLWSFIYI